MREGRHGVPIAARLVVWRFLGKHIVAVKIQEQVGLDFDEALRKVKTIVR
jgi:hypothetical protein